jgi:transposase
MGDEMEAGKRKYVGIDAGKATMVVMMCEEGTNGEKIIRWQGRTDFKGREKLRSMLKAGDVVGIEAGEPGFTIAREIRDMVGAKVLVLNPGRLAIIFKSMCKTDAEDALKIMRLVMRNPENELPLVTIPDDDERRKRAIVSEDDFLARTRTRLILRLHSVYLRAGITTLQRKDLQTADKRSEALKLLKDKEAYFLKEAGRLEELLGLVEEELEDIERESRVELNREDLTPILMSAPGVGPSFALAFSAYIGDGSRFENGPQVSNYVGFVPSIYISGKTVITGHITKRGCRHIRRLAVQAAWALVRSKEGGALKMKYQELRVRRGKKIAIVAVAKKLVEVMWAMARTKTVYKYSTPEMLKKKFRYYKIEVKGSVA